MFAADWCHHGETVSGGVSGLPVKLDGMADGGRSGVGAFASGGTGKMERPVIAEEYKEKLE